MIYQVRWKPVGDETEYTSRTHMSTQEAAEFACVLLAQMEVSDIWIVDGGGQRVMMMPEIVQLGRSRQER